MLKYTWPNLVVIGKLGDVRMSFRDVNGRYMSNKKPSISQHENRHFKQVLSS